MRKTSLLAALAFAITSAMAAQQASAPILVEDRDVKVDRLDFEASLLRIPEDTRGNILMSYDRVASMVDNIFIARVLASKARESGIDKEPLVQRRMEQAAEAVLADVYVARLERDAIQTNLEQRARELYRADPSKYKTEEQVHIQQILVNMHGRTRDQATERAKMIAAKAQAGEDFLTLAGQYSDDSEKRINKGDLGFTSPKALAAGIRNALAPLKPGQVIGPVETEHGFHVVKLVERKAPQQLTYDMVREQIVRTEKARLTKERISQLLTQVRSSPTATVHRENVEALVVPLPPELTSGKVQEQAAKAKN